METKDVYTQEELMKAIEESFYPICRGENEFEISGSAQVRASGSAQVRAYGSAQVTAYGSAQVTAYGSAQVMAYDSAQVTAYDSAQVRAYDSAQVTAYGSAQVRAYGSAQVRASKYVAVTTDGAFRGTVAGGTRIEIPPVKTALEWCEFYGAPIHRGVVVLYKAVGDDWKPSRDIAYVPGTKPSAPDWDGGKQECGGGLHFCATPVHALSYKQDATHFIACPVKVSEIAVHFPAQYPDKVKAPRVYRACYEVDIDGNRVYRRSP